MDSRSFTAGNFLGGDQLTEAERDGIDLVVTDVTVEEMRSGDDKLCLAFDAKHGKKPLLLNKTNSKRMQKMFGHDTDNWIGQEITIWFDPEVEFMGDIVGGLRIRVKKK